ncbi:C40 family peptidase [Nocardioides stalactiti]|uniref:C40 family peptidase n=1 Tax=Nocardioides stalactiti TaxID=2755356 RepID=UPI001C81BDCF|nr:C40 family peptidase [Nocardioides stalactiti]
MHTISVRALARRPAVAATVAALTATPVVAPAPASARATPVAEDGSLSTVVGGPAAHPRAAQRRTELRLEREAQERARVRAERRAEREAAEAAASRGEQVLALAAREAGDPYVYGAAGPDAFDCSGLTQYVFAQLGISLPHSSSAQAGVATRVSDPQLGDLVFFSDGGGVYHVAIYAGDGMVWHAPRTGDVVKLEAIWTSSVFYGRVL